MSVATSVIFNIYIYSYCLQLFGNREHKQTPCVCQALPGLPGVMCKDERNKPRQGGEERADRAAAAIAASPIFLREKG